MYQDICLLYNFLSCFLLSHTDEYVDNLLPRIMFLSRVKEEILLIFNNDIYFEIYEPISTWGVIQ